MKGVKRMFWDKHKKLLRLIKIACVAAIVFGIVFGGHWYLKNTESGKRFSKSINSELSGGINRTVTVYSYDGKVIGQWSGKFDVTEDDQETYFDIDGKRVVIQGGIIINEEKEKTVD